MAVTDSKYPLRGRRPALFCKNAACGSYGTALHKGVTRSMVYNVVFCQSKLTSFFLFFFGGGGLLCVILLC